jgi:hypothetical protein
MTSPLEKTAHPLDNHSVTELLLRRNEESAVIEMARRRIAAVNDEIERRYKNVMADNLVALGKDHGTLNQTLEGGAVEVKFVRSKKVKWDGAKLMSIASTLPWDRASAIFKIDFSMPEKIYSALAGVDPDLKAKRHILVAEGGAGKTFLCLDLAMQLAAHEPGSPGRWLGQDVLAPAEGGMVVMLTAEDDKDELHIRMHDIDPSGDLRRRAGDRLMIVPLENAGGAFPLVGYDGRAGEPGPTPRWAAFLNVLRALPKVSCVIIDTLNATLHGEENSASVLQEYFREISPVCGEIGAAFLVTHHIRKMGQNIIRTADDMKEAVRGSSAILPGVRVALGFWHASDYKRRLKSLGEAPAPGRLYRMAVLKANNPEMVAGTKTLLRQPTGLLTDVTAKDKLKDGPGPEHEAWMLVAIKEGAANGHAFTKTNTNGVFERKHHLPPILQDLTRSELHRMVDKLTAARVATTGRPASSKGGASGYLDIPGGPMTKKQGYFNPGAWEPDWDGFVYESTVQKVIRL